MQEKPFRVVNKNGVSWAVRFVSEDAAWGRLLSLKGGYADTKKTRNAFLREGWKIIDTNEVTSLNGGL